MSPLVLLFAGALAAMVAAYFLLTRQSTHHSGEGGAERRPDGEERPEFTGAEQYKHRQIK